MRQTVKTLGVGFILTWAVKILPVSLLVTSADLSGVCTCWGEGKFDPCYVEFWKQNKSHLSCVGWFGFFGWLVFCFFGFF